MKKNPKFNLEKRRGLYFQLGVLVSLSFVLVAFTWTDYTKTFHSSLGFYTDDAIEIDIIETSTRSKPKPKPPVMIMSLVKIGPETPEPDPDPIIPDIDPNDPRFDIDDNWDEDLKDDPDGNGIGDDSMPLSPLRVEIAPYYEDCTNVLDRKQQMDCSYHKIKQFVNANTTYPALCREIGAEGTVHMSFVVNKKGELEDIKVERGVHPLMDKEAIRVFKTIPKLIPASQQGKAVKVRFNMPVKFELR